MQIDPRPSNVTDPSALHRGEVARHDVALAVHHDEHLGRLDGVVVVADGDVTGAGNLSDHTRARLDGFEVLVEDDGPAE